MLYAVLPKIKKILNENSYKCEHLSFIHMNRSYKNKQASSLMLFLDNDTFPAILVKIAIDPSNTVALEQEYQNLKKLHDCDNTMFANSIPKPIFQGNIQNLALLMETVLPGDRIKDFATVSYFRSSRFHYHLVAIVNWLLNFHTHAGIQPLTQEHHDKLLQLPLDNYRNYYKFSNELNDLLEEVKDRLLETSIPLVAWHGDFCTANILVNGKNRIGVIDWEYPFQACWPFGDLVYFFSSMWCISGGKGLEPRDRNYKYLFFHKSVTRSIMEEATSFYVDGLGLDRSMILPLIVISWVIFANSKMKELGMKKQVVRNDQARGILPLVIVRDGYCMNLELLARYRQSFIWDS